MDKENQTRALSSDDSKSIVGDERQPLFTIFYMKYPVCPEEILYGKKKADGHVLELVTFVLD
uniref:Uncharacterized protein n=1 Tax=Timema bartmani TaxID=61472 RepID=A0A7R9F9U5_9NEOP|nr:unnamed protein product [Timema bartmani]